jgi:transcriptional regulator with XRE-family HTH domain
MMADDTIEDPITELIEAYIAHLEGEGPAPSLEDLDTHAKREARNAFRAVDAAWRSDLEIPPLEEDPVALALGFVPAANASTEVIVSGSLVTKARRRRKLKASDVANRLQSMGLDANQQWLVRLERSSVQEIKTDLATGLATVLGVSVDALAAERDKDVDPFATWLYSDEFDVAFAAWVDEQEGRELPKDLAPRARSQLLTAVRRSAGDGEPTLWAAMLRSVLDELS